MRRMGRRSCIIKCNGEKKGGWRERERDNDLAGSALPVSHEWCRHSSLQSLPHTYDTHALAFSRAPRGYLRREQRPPSPRRGSVTISYALRVSLPYNSFLRDAPRLRMRPGNTLFTRFCATVSWESCSVVLHFLFLFFPIFHSRVKMKRSAEMSKDVQRLCCKRNL